MCPYRWSHTPPGHDQNCLASGDAWNSLCRHLFVHPVVERVLICAGVHLVAAAKDDPRRRRQRVDEGGRVLLGCTDGWCLVWLYSDCLRLLLFCRTLRLGYDRSCERMSAERAVCATQRRPKSNSSKN